MTLFLPSIVAAQSDAAPSRCYRLTYGRDSVEGWLPLVARLGGSDGVQRFWFDGGVDGRAMERATYGLANYNRISDDSIRILTPAGDVVREELRAREVDDRLAGTMRWTLEHSLTTSTDSIHGVRTECPSTARLYLPARTRVRMQAGLHGVIIGDVVQASFDSIIVNDELTRTRRAFSLGVVRGLERSLGHPELKRNVGRFALVGAVAGAVVGYNVGDSGGCVDRPCRSPRVGIALGFSGLLAAAGAVTASMVTPERWQTVFDKRAH